MAPSTRNFLIGSAFVVVTGLCTGLVAYWNGALPGRAAASEFAYIPADASAVAFADVRDIMNSEFRQKLRQVMPTGSEKDRLLEETGIDIERDIDTVVAGLNGQGPAGAIVVFNGRFDQARIEGLAVRNGATQEQYGGKALLVGFRNQDGDHDGNQAGPDDHMPAIAFLESNLLALGDVRAVRKAIDMAALDQGLPANPDLMRFIASVQGTGNAWLVGRASHMTGHSELPAQVRSQVENLEWVSVSANVDRDVRGLIRAEARDDEAGQQLRAVIAGAIAAAKIFSNEDPRMAAALNSVQTAGAGRNVELSFTVPSAVLDLIAQHHEPAMAQ